MVSILAIPYQHCCCVFLLFDVHLPCNYSLLQNSRLNILYKFFVCGKYLSNKRKKIFATFVLTLVLNGAIKSYDVPLPIHICFRCSFGGVLQI